MGAIRAYCLMLEIQLTTSEDPLHREVRFIGEAVREILRGLPVQRRPLSDTTKELHLQVTLARRSGFCPCCQRVKVCSPCGRIEGAEYDHFYARHRNGPAETWLVCGPCNRQLEDPAFKSNVRCCFEAYQQALNAIFESGQRNLFECHTT